MAMRRSSESAVDVASRLIGSASVRSDDRRRRQILSDIAEAEQSLRTAWRQMNEATDHDLIDSAIYSVKAAEMRYGALIRMLREGQ